MYKINRLTNPTIPHLRKISANLKEKYPEHDTKVGVKCTSWYAEPRFSIYISSVKCRIALTLDQLYHEYFKSMKGK